MINISTFEDPDRAPVLIEEIEWYRPIADLSLSPVEKREMEEARRYQQRLGILDQIGLPSGMTLREKIKLLPVGHPIRKQMEIKLRELEENNKQKKKRKKR